MDGISWIMSQSKSFLPQVLSVRCCHRDEKRGWHLPSSTSPPGMAQVIRTGQSTLTPHCHSTSTAGTRVCTRPYTFYGLGRIYGAIYPPWCCPIRLASLLLCSSSVHPFYHTSSRFMKSTHYREGTRALFVIFFMPLTFPSSLFPIFLSFLSSLRSPSPLLHWRMSLGPHAHHASTPPMIVSSMSKERTAVRWMAFRGGAFGKWSGHEDGTLIIGIRAL